MSAPPGRQSPGAANPGADVRATNSALSTIAQHLDIEIPDALRRRRVASYRLPAFDACGDRDPLDCLAGELPNISGYARWSMTEAEARRFANDLVAKWGFSDDEVATLLGVRPVAA